MAACSKYFEVYLMPLSNMAGLFQNANSIPSEMPMTGPPIMGNNLPKYQAGIDMQATRKIPGNIFAIL